MPPALDLVRQTMADPRFHETPPDNQLRFRDTILIPALRADPQFMATPPENQQAFIDREINSKLTVAGPLEQSIQQTTGIIPQEELGLIQRGASAVGGAAKTILGPVVSGLAEGVHQLSRPLYGVNNVLKRAAEVQPPAPGEPGKTLPQVLQQDVAQPFMRGMTLQETTGGPQVASAWGKRFRQITGMPEPVSGSLAGKLTHGAEGVAGLALDVLNPAGRGVFEGLGAAGSALAKSVPVVRGMEAAKAAMSDVFKVRYGAPETYQKVADLTEATISNRTEDAFKQANDLIDGLTPMQRMIAGRYMQSPVSRTLAASDQQVINVVNPARQTLDQLSKEVRDQYVKGGFVPANIKDALVKTITDNLGTYLPRLYKVFEVQAKLPKPPGSDMAQILKMDSQQQQALSDLSPEAAQAVMDLFHYAGEQSLRPSFAARLMKIPEAVLKARTNPDDVFRMALGEIRQPGYPFAKKAAELIRTVETAKLYTTIAKNPEWFSEVRKAGFSPLPDSIRQYGPLAGKFVQENIARDLLSTSNPLVQNSIMQGWMKVLGMWKFGKVVLNPATHARNLMSNVMLLDFSGVDVAAQPRYLWNAITEMKKGGRNYLDLRNAGGLGREYIGGELDQMQKSIEALNPTDTMLHLAMTPVRVGAERAGTLYQKEEQVFKLAKFMWERDHGKSVVDASQEAEKWLFNYGKVSPFIKTLRQMPLGSPFATFSAKVLPRIAETAITEPWRIAKYQILFNSIENETKQKYGLSDRDLTRLKSSNPGYAIVLPVKDANGQFQVMDLSYLLPWGNVTEQGSLIPQIPQAFSPGGPIQGLGEAATGIDFYKRRLGLPFEFREVGKGLPTGFTPTQATLNQIHRSLLPPLTPGIPGVTGPSPEPNGPGENKSYIRRVFEAAARSGGFGAQKIAAAATGLPDRMGRVRSPALTAADVLGGIKISPADLQQKRLQEIRNTLSQIGVNADSVETGQGLLHELYRISTDKSLSDSAKVRLKALVLQSVAELRKTLAEQVK